MVLTIDSSSDEDEQMGLCGFHMENKHDSLFASLFDICRFCKQNREEQQSNVPEEKKKITAKLPPVVPPPTTACMWRHVPVDEQKTTSFEVHSQLPNFDLGVQKDDEKRGLAIPMLSEDTLVTFNFVEFYLSNF